jgi:hypothetical protein
VSLKDSSTTNAEVNAAVQLQRNISSTLKEFSKKKKNFISMVLVNRKLGFAATRIGF